MKEELEADVNGPDDFLGGEGVGIGEEGYKVFIAEICFEHQILNDIPA
jgi:hypothetical protein